MINNTGETVTALHLSPANADNWGPNIAGDGDIASGETRQVRFGRATGSCLTDIQITYPGGDTSKVSDVNFCGITTVSLNSVALEGQQDRAWLSDFHSITDDGRPARRHRSVDRLVAGSARPARRSIDTSELGE